MKKPRALRLRRCLGADLLPLCVTSPAVSHPLARLAQTHIWGSDCGGSHCIPDVGELENGLATTKAPRWLVPCQTLPEALPVDNSFAAHRHIGEVLNPIALLASVDVLRDLHPEGRCQRRFACTTT
jgi:hypothetical protein